MPETTTLCEHERAAEARADAERRLSQYEGIRRELELDEDHAEDRPFWLLTVSAGEHTARAASAWADEALATLDKMDASKQRRRR